MNADRVALEAALDFSRGQETVIAGMRKELAVKAQEVDQLRDQVQRARRMLDPQDQPYGLTNQASPEKGYPSGQHLGPNPLERLISELR